MSVNNFDVLRAMGDAEQDIRVAPLSNVIYMQRTKKGTQITIGVDGDVVAGLAKGRFVGGLILADKEQFEAMRRALEGSE